MSASIHTEKTVAEARLRRTGATPAPSRRALLGQLLRSSGAGLTLLRFGLAAIVTVAEAGGLYHTSLAAAFGMLITIAAAAPGRRHVNAHACMIATAADSLFVISALAVLAYRLHVPPYLPIAACVLATVTCLRWLFTGQTVTSGFARSANLLCIACIALLYLVRVQATAYYVPLTSYSPPLLAAFLGAAALETVLEGFADTLSSRLRTPPAHDDDRLSGQR